MIDVGVIDSGFAVLSGAIPRGRVEWTAIPWGAIGQPNGTGCGPGNPCPWHGTQVAQAIGSPFDDGFGGVGSAGSVARLSYYEVYYDGFGVTAAAAQASRDGQRVVNMSFTSVALPIGLNWTLLPFDAALAVASSNMILVAASGNNNVDVASGVADEEIDLLTWWPCESQVVFCVGATDWQGNRENFSNWSVSPLGVDVFAPDGQILWGISADGLGLGTMQNVFGTSLSSPWVAGILALARAAAPDKGPSWFTDAAIATAWVSGRPQVNRMIDADALVRRALAEGSRAFDANAFRPIVEIVTPVAGERPYGDLRFEIRASQPGAHAGLDCCTYEWTSTEPGDGVFPAGPIFTKTLLPGVRTISVVAVNAFGLRSDPDSVLLDLRNLPPEMTAGLSGLNLPGSTLIVSVDASDPNGDLFDCMDIRIDVTPGESFVSNFMEDGPPGGRPTCTFRVTVAPAYSGPMNFDLLLTDALGLTTAVNLATVIEAIAEPLIAITRPGFSPLPYATTGPQLTVEAVSNAEGTQRWYATPLDDAFNALAGLQFLRDGDGLVDLNGWGAWLDQGLCLRPQGQLVSLSVELLNPVGEVLHAHSLYIWVVCPPG